MLPVLYGITLRRVLSLKCMQDAKVLAGAAGLDQRVTSVNVMEVPDILPWVSPNQLLLTTCYSIKDNHEAQQRLIPELADKGLAGLVIKAKRYLDEVPATMVEQAEALGFPLIEMSQSASHSEILREVYEALVSRQITMLKRTVEVHGMLSEVLAAGGGLGTLATAISGMLARPAYILAVSGEVLATGHPASGGAGTASLELPPRNAPLPHTSERLTLPQPPGSTGDRTFFSVPIWAGRRLHGHVLVEETSQPLDPREVISLEQAAVLAALALVNQRAVQAVETKYRNEFLYDWLTGEIDSVHTLLSQAKRVGWDLQRSFRLMVVEMDEFGASFVIDMEGALKLKEQVQGAINRALQSLSEPCVVGDRGGYFIILVPVKAAWSEKALQERVLVVAKAVKAAVAAAVPHSPITIGVGRFYQDLFRMRQAFDEARQSVRVGKSARGPGDIYFYEDLGVYRLLSQVGSPRELRSFYTETVTPLIQYDTKHGTDLVGTLKCYFELNGNIRAVARQLHTHYNTVLYRLGRIRDLTSLDVNRPDDRLSLQMGLKIAEMLATTPEAEVL